MKSFRVFALLGIVLSGLLLAGCHDNGSAYHPRDSLAGQIGKKCTVQFRRDALGIADAKGHGIEPLSPAADVKIEGTLTALDADYLILRRQDNHQVVWIHSSVVLLVSFDAEE